MRVILTAILVASALCLAACSDSDDTPTAPVPIVKVEKTFTPSSDRAGTDLSGDGIATSLGRETTTGNAIGLLLDPGDPPDNPATFEEIRLAFEFDLSAIPAGATITSAVVQLTLSSAGAYTGLKEFELHVYGGNGTVELADFLTDNLAAGPFIVDDQTLPITHELKTKLAPFFSAGASSIGVIIRHTPVANPAANFISLIPIRTSNFSDALQHPKLIVQYIEP